MGRKTLGNRSIIADPRGDKIKEEINSKIKEESHLDHLLL